MFSNTNTKTRSGLIAVALTTVFSGAVAPMAVAGTPAGLAPVIGCAAPGGKQEAGALIGALLGAAAGSNLAKNDRGTGTAIGAVVGAGVGSTVGCKLQESRQQREYSANQAQGFGQVYSSGGVKLAQYVQPARFDRTSGQVMARSNINIRSGPGTGYGRVGGLVSGQTIEAMAVANGGQWILVGRNGVGIGYVHGAYVGPANGFQRAGY